jgi:hypothetical protein
MIHRLRLHQFLGVSFTPPFLLTPTHPQVSNTYRLTFHGPRLLRGEDAPFNMIRAATPTSTATARTTSTSFTSTG